MTLYPDVPSMADGSDATYLDGRFDPVLAGKIVVGTLPDTFTWTLRAKDAPVDPLYPWTVSQLAFAITNAALTDFPVHNFTAASDVATTYTVAIDITALRAYVGAGPYTIHLEPTSWEEWYSSFVLYDWSVDFQTAIPMRQKQRNDGLARSSVRARGGSSRQDSIRQRSYY